MHNQLVNIYLIKDLARISGHSTHTLKYYLRLGLIAEIGRSPETNFRYFDDATLDKLTQDDKVLIHAYGQGFTLMDYPDIKVFSLAPRLFKEIGIVVVDDYRIEVPVAAVVPGMLMGSGLGHNDVFKGDYDIQTSDQETIRRCRLDQLRLGDFVAIQDHDSSYGWTYREGAVTIGVVIHTDSHLAGHGPGVQTTMTSRKSLIIPKLNPEANLGRYLKIGRWRS